MRTSRISCVLIVAFAAWCAYVNAPALLPQGQAYRWRNVEILVGGFVPGIVFNQSEPNLVYARTDIGGAYCLDPSTNR